MLPQTRIFEYFRPKIRNPGIENKKPNPPKWEKPGFKPDPGKPGPFTSLKGKNLKMLLIDYKQGEQNHFGRSILYEFFKTTKFCIFHNVKSENIG